MSNKDLRSAITRRCLLGYPVIAGAALAAPSLLTGARPTAGQSLSASAFAKAKIDWKQFSGEEITVAVIPAGYFNNLIDVAGAFEELSGVRVRFQKVLLDLSSKTGTYATHAADPMYYPLYVANKWVEPLHAYLKDPKISDPAWFDYDDILEGWRGACSIGAEPYGIPFDGEATVQVYRKDVYEKAGIKPAETFDEFVANAAKVHDPANRLWGAALRGFRGAGQNMYIYPSIFRAFGGEWFDSNKKLVVTTEPAIKALQWYADLLRNYAPPGVENWNWPDIADAFGQGTVAVYIDAHSSAGVINDLQKSKVIGKIAYARWPKGPAGKRVTSIWNWGFPINAALPERKKKATWLFIQWATSKETQIATTYDFSGTYKRTGANRTSLWQDPQYRKLMESFGDNLVDVTTASFREDIDLEWRPRIAQWPAVGEIMATAVQAALVGQAMPKDALTEAQRKIEQVMRS
jgi:multiple sugar transport system substrate-binding protein